MKRHLLPGYFDRDGIARAHLRCTGACEVGEPCTCETELQCDVAPDADRVIQPPKPAPVPNHRARAAYAAMAIAALLYLAIAALLKWSGSRSFS